MLRYGICSITVLVLWSSFCTAADFRCQLTEIEIGKSITVRVDGKERKLKLDDKTEYVNANFPKVKIEGDQVKSMLRETKEAKAAMDIAITTKGEKDDEVVAKLVYNIPSDRERPKVKDAPANVPGELKGTWKIDAIITAEGCLTGFDETIVFRDKGMEWAEPISRLFEAKGKAAFTIDTKKSPATIEFKAGDAAYKGLWVIEALKAGKNDKMKERLQMVLSAPGGDLPKDLPTDMGVIKLPPGTKGVLIRALREIK